MKEYTFTDPQGRNLIVSSPDNSIPTEQELDQMFSAKYGQQKSFLGRMGTTAEQIGTGLLNLPGQAVSSVVQPAAKLFGRFGQGVVQVIDRKPPVPYSIPMPKYFGGPIDIAPAKTFGEAFGPAAQTAALAVGPTLGGAMYGGGKAMEEGKSGLQIAGQTAMGAGFGKALGMIAGEPLLTGKTGQFIAKKVTPALKESSARIVNSLIKPLLKDFSYGKNPGLGVAQEGIVANNLDELANKISVARQNKGQEISAVLAKPQYQNIKLDLSTAIAPIDEAMQTAATQNNQTLLNRLQDTKRAITQDLTLAMENGQPMIKSFGDKNLSSLTPAEATKIKTGIGDLTKWTGNISDDKLVNKALKQVYGNIKEKIGNAVPEIRPLNERYANLTSAEIATKYRDKIEQRQNLISLAPRIAGYTGALASLATGNPKLLMDSIAVIGAEKIMNSTILKTRLAVGLNKLSASDLLKVGESYPLLIRAARKIRKY